MITPNIGADEVSESQVPSQLRKLVEGIPIGASAIPFDGGRALRQANKPLYTVAMVVVELKKEVRESTYEYLYAIQSITQRVRFVIITDTDELRSIRRYGWLIEHLIARSSLHKLEPSLNWIDVVAQRIVATAERLDVSKILVATEEGVTQQMHLCLMGALGLSIPFGAVAFRPRKGEDY